MRLNNNTLSIDSHRVWWSNTYCIRIKTICLKILVIWASPINKDILAIFYLIYKLFLAFCLKYVNFESVFRIGQTYELLSFNKVLEFNKEQCSAAFVFDWLIGAF